MKPLIIHTPDRHIADRGYSGARWFAMLQTGAEPTTWGPHLNRLQGRVIGVYVGWGRHRYLSVGRYTGSPSTTRTLKVGRRPAAARWPQ